MTCVSLTAHAQLSFNRGGVNVAAVETPADPSTGLSAIYVAESMSGVTLSYTAASRNVAVSRFSNLGGGYAEALTDVSRNGDIISFTPGTSDTGIIIDDGTKRTCYWIVNYANHELDLEGLEISDESDCSFAALTLSGDASPITYYTINGRALELSRELQFSYNNLVFDEDNCLWRQENVETILSSVRGLIAVESPFCDTNFTLQGDRFLKSWGRDRQVESSRFRTKAVSAVTQAVQIARDASNEKKPEVSGLGGSAPCEVTFTAYPTDAAVFHEWQFSQFEDFNDVFDRFTTDEFTYVFDDKGTTYARYVCGDDSGDCFYYGDVYTISVGESRLEIPNAFSPGNEDGVNDEWKVSYQSLVSFECHIFNRWGTKIATLTDPSQGWDGKYKGKLVPSGVYFYVIKARGADGVNYNKSGDINILHSRTYGGNTSGDE